MLDISANGLGGAAGPYLVARVATGLFFVFSGYHKLTNADRRAVFIATLRDCHVPFISVMQWFVPAVEFLRGLGVAFGFLTPDRRARSLLPSVLLRPVRTVYAGSGTWAAIDKADVVDDVLYLPEVLYILLLGLFIAQGAGPFSLDAVLSGFL